MGKSRDLKTEEKSKAVQLLAGGQSTLQIAKLLGRDHRTIKGYIDKPDKLRQRVNKRKFMNITRKEITLLKKSMSKKPLVTSKEVFIEAGIHDVPKTTRWRILSTIGQVKTSRKQPPLSKANIEKRMIWAKNNMKTHFENVVFTDECRATLDGPDGFARGWIIDKTD